MRLLIRKGKEEKKEEGQVSLPLIKSVGIIQNKLVFRANTSAQYNLKQVKGNSAIFKTILKMAE